MHWFLDPIKNHYFDFDGRVARKPFWMYILMYVIVVVVANIVLSIVGLEMLAPLISLALLLPSLGITARRLHDTGRSGWWQLIGLVPLLGLIVMIYFTVQDSEPGANMYGANPNDGGDMPPVPEAAPAEAGDAMAAAPAMDAPAAPMAESAEDTQQM